MWTLPSDISEAAKLKLEEHSSVLVSYVRELNELDALTLFKKGLRSILVNVFFGKIHLKQ